jgi:O-succinylbenzoate synthase
MAKAAIEMALWDWWGRAQRQPLWSLIGGDPGKREAPVGVSIGIQASPQALVRVAQGYLQQGYRRLKVKIKPGQDLVPLSALREAVGPEILIMADANSAYRLDRDLERLRQFDALDLMMIEQPLDEDDYVDHAVLAASLKTPVCLDESIRSGDDARRAIGLGAAGIINIKVGRVGGIASAQAVHDIALQNHVPVWCGGMLETGIGRAFNVHLTTLPNFSLPGDTSASDRYFDEDLIDPPFTLNPNGTLTVPEGDGIGVRPDPKRLSAVSSYQETWNLSRQGQRGGVPDVRGLGF